MEIQEQKTEELKQNENQIKTQKIPKRIITIQKIICIIVVLVGILFICKGIKDYKNISIPSSVLNTDCSVQYVGGDAYNLIIASGIRGGEISSAMTEKSIATNYILVGTILLCFSLIVLFNKKK